ncbi:hypothetical protein [Aquimarina rubra]|uniref:Toxin-antitoxin system YwqK family antitoxin n=1 Tax=Aquimarina rubra TaxID=1920033 RepID=A0ABW5L9H5_9FLAO
MYIKWFFLIFISAVFICCKRTDGSRETFKAAVDNKVTSNKAPQKDVQSKDVAKYKLPFGAEELLSSKFPKDTTIVFGYNMNERPEIEKTIEKIDKYYKVFNLWSKEDSIKVSYNDSKNDYSSTPENYRYYDIPLVSAKKSKLTENNLFYCRPYESFVKTGKISDLDTFDVYLYSTFPKYYDHNFGNNCNGDNPVTVTDLVVKSKEGKLIDACNIYYSTNEPVNTYQVYPYIDNNFIITLQSMMGGESFQYIRNEKWQIKPNGKIVRFYEKDGLYKGREEQGLVKNSMREGVWIEMKPNGFVNEMTYLEAEFKEGEPINEWKYYSFKNFNKGNLLYTETFKNGKLHKRVFK